MNTITVTYSLKWQIKFAPEYRWTVCKKLFNTKTGKQIKKTVNGGSVGYWIKGDFYILSKLRTELELIPKTRTLPF